MPIAKIRSDLSAARFKAPLVVQPLIDAPYEHRVTVVGDAVFAARTERTGHNAVDVRTVPVSEAGVTRSRLPDAVISQCVRLVDGLGLDYAVLDLLETGAGDYVFLDLNPAGHFLWVEQLTGAPITDAIADLLLDGCAIGARS